VGPNFASAEEVARTLVASVQGRPIYLQDIARVAFTVTPWASFHLLQSEYGKAGHEPLDMKLVPR